MCGGQNSVVGCRELRVMGSFLTTWNKSFFQWVQGGDVVEAGGGMSTSFRAGVKVR